ncbi:3-dehydroquinate synthase [Listeria costaricensis]|uniref:3-dehydroquinate synthase n=1 Tax=Listeria costaricensis TaxID=2026604 RepID=UPI000C0741D6|nr:3-dehydroquinate synthase [Listeria costaricensis]
MGEEKWIHAASKTYPVYIGQNIWQEVGQTILSALSSYSKVFVVTDQHVAALHKEKLDAWLAPLDEVIYYITPNGEEAKSFAVYEDVMTRAIESGLDRKSVLLAFGGGVIGDLGGFVAATYMRGIPFYQLPTTVLAHDSAVGGKVAINHPLGKNLIGQFYQPEAVLYDTGLLGTLPEREMRSGFAELIKHALISDQQLLDTLITTYRKPEDFYTHDLTAFLSQGIDVKAQIVAQDETEQGVRAYLNFGHTFGHALEACGGFKRWLHGEAIIFGMLFALRMSGEQLNLAFDLANFEAWLTDLGYETVLPQDVTFEKLYQNMLHDKKTTYQEVKMVLLREIGDLVITPASESALESIFQKMKREGA